MSYQQDTPVAPRFDVNAPDLYIPTMGFITYVLVAGLALGTQNRYIAHAFSLLFARYFKQLITDYTQLTMHCCAPIRFSPELLGVQASSALVWLIMEVLAVLLSLYLVTVNTDLTTIDLLAFSGYKYVGYVRPFYFCVYLFIMTHPVLYSKSSIFFSFLISSNDSAFPEQCQGSFGCHT